MRNFKFYPLSLLLMSMLFLSLSSCKKCKLEGENMDVGVINTDVMIYPEQGYITQYLAGPIIHIHGNSDVADKFEMSTDNGFTRSSFNYSQYSIMAFPLMLSSCNHLLNREVKVDDLNGTVTYNIIVTQCKDAECSQELYMENYVVVPAIPESYTVLGTVEYIEQ